MRNKKSRGLFDDQFRLEKISKLKDPLEKQNRYIRFKEETVYCNLCKRHIKKHEEKETDVSIAVKILESFSLNECDLAVVITGDTDLIIMVIICTCSGNPLPSSRAQSIHKSLFLLSVFSDENKK
jgi:uncharacterized LabA/DUF88 family protein